MSNWERFEINVVKLLNENLKKVCDHIIFENEGGKDSTKPDIKVKLRDKDLFKIEAKMSMAQCGQFVIELIKDEYKVSTKGKTNNSFTSKIIDFINENISDYNNIEQNGVNLNCQSDLLENWVIEHYKSKNSDWIITSNSYENLNLQNIAIYPIDDIKKYFKITACLRKKKSGSSHLPKKYDAFIEEELKKIFLDKTILFNRVGSKVIVKINDINSNKRFGPDNKYFLSKDDELESNEYYVKKLSLTNNINVIFSIKWTSNPTTSHFEELKQILKKYIK